MSKIRSTKRLVSLFFTLALMFSFMAPLAQPVAAGSVAEADRLFFCNFLNQGLSLDPSQPKINGDVATWWATYGPAGGVDCIDLAVYNSPETCTLDATFNSYVYAATNAGWAYHDKLTWYELDDLGNVVQYSTTFPVSFPEDHSGGSVQVLINFNSPENQISVGLGADDISHWRTTSRGVEYTVDTDCKGPVTEEVQWCSPGYWKNNTADWPVDTNTLFVDVFGYEPVGKKAPATGATLLYVLQNPKIYGGELTEMVADYLSDEHPDIYFTGERYNQGADGTWYHVCPLEGN